MPAKKKRITLALVYEKLLEHDAQFTEVARYFFRLEDSLRAEIGSVLDRVRQLERVLDKQTADIDLLRQEYFALLQAVRRIEERLDAIEGRLESVEASLKSVEGRLDSVEGRLESVEGRLESVEAKLQEVFLRLEGVEQRLVLIESESRSS